MGTLMGSQALSRTRLVTLVGKRLGDLGYRRLPINPIPGIPVFAKLVCDPLILGLGLEFSRLYETRFTGSLYLAPWLSWGTGVGLPLEAHERIGRFLKRRER